MSEIIPAERSSHFQNYILRLDAVCFPADPPTEINIRSPNEWWWLIRHPNERGGYVAYAGLRRMQDWHDMYLCRVGVLPAFRGHGWQERLIKVREAKARKEKADWLVTDTVYWNTPSMVSLIRRGFEPYTPELPWKPAGVGVIYWRKRL